MSELTRKEVVFILKSGKNFQRADLSGLDLRGFDLSGANLSEANLAGAVLSGANLKGADLSGADLRLANVDDAFVARGTLAVSCALVVDDVCTTGATLSACAAALHQAGVGRVVALTFARAVHRPPL